MTVDNGTEIISEPIRLHDRASGDPDLVANDGAYSRYLTDYPHGGRYRFENERALFAATVGGEFDPNERSDLQSMAGAGVKSVQFDI